MHNMKGMEESNKYLQYWSVKLRKKKIRRKKNLRKATTTSECVPNKGAPHTIAKNTYKIAYIIYYNIYYKCIFYP